MDIKQYFVSIIILPFSANIPPMQHTSYLYSNSWKSMQHLPLHHRPADNCSVGLRSWCYTYCLQSCKGLLVSLRLSVGGESYVLWLSLPLPPQASSEGIAVVLCVSVCVCMCVCVCVCECVCVCVCVWVCVCAQLFCSECCYFLSAYSKDSRHSQLLQKVVFSQ